MEVRRLVLAMVLCGIVAILHAYHRSLIEADESKKRKAAQEAEQLANGTGTRTEGPGTATQNSGVSDAETTDPTGTSTAGTVTEPPPPAQFPVFEAETRTLFTDVFTISFSSEGASITEIVLEQHLEMNSDKAVKLLSQKDLLSGLAFTLELENAPQIPLADAHWKLDRFDEEKLEIAFRYPLPNGGGDVVKTYRLDKATYLIYLTIDFPESLVSSKGHGYFLRGPERIRHDTGRMGAINYKVTAFAGNDGLLREAERDAVEALQTSPLQDVGRVLWSGLESNYFACTIRPVMGQSPLSVQAWVWQEQGRPPGDTALGQQVHPFQVGIRRELPQQVESHSFEIFVGPKERSVLKGIDDGASYTELIDYGWFGWLVRLFLFLLTLFHKIFSSYGIAIICITILVKLILHPLNRKNQAMMQRNQKKMSKIQPQMRELREKHKNDPMKANREIQKLMKEADVNPAQMFGGCLLMFLQLPVWIGLFKTFNLAIELRGTPFLYIADLTQPDRLFPLPFTVPILGWEYFNLLPVVYVILTLINQRMMPKSDDPQMQQQQKMMSFMMVAFGFIFYNFSAGLLLYFLTNSGLGIIEQKIIRAELKREGLS